MKMTDIKRKMAGGAKKKWSTAKIINIILIIVVFFSIVRIVIAVTPNPGHSWTETGDGTFQVTGPTALRTYTFPDADATIFTGAEADPTFTAWDKSTGISITESQISDLQAYLLAETDPVYTAWNKTTGISITESQISDLQAYLLAETDPVYTAWNKSTGISITESQISDLQAYLLAETDPVFVAQKGAANGVATLGADSKIPSAQLPLITISNTFVVAGEAEMLALTAETGDVAVRTDLNESYILAGDDPSDINDWQQLLTPTDTVLSVNGATGVVVLTTTNIAEGTNLYYTDARAIAAPITGYVSGAGVVADTDTILEAIQKLNGNIDAIDLSGYVPYTGGTTNVDLGVHNLTVDTNSLFVNSATHKVGIGTIAPTAPLFIHMSEDAWTITPANSTGLVIQNSLAGNSAYLSIISYDPGQAGINFGTEADENIGGIYYGNSVTGNDNMTFNVMSATYMTLQAGGPEDDTGVLMRKRVGILETGASPTYYAYLEAGNQTGNVYLTLPVTQAPGVEEDSGYPLIGTTSGEEGAGSALSWNDQRVKTTSDVTFNSLVLAAGTTSNAPLKLTAGTNLATTEAGAIEFDGTHLYFTVANAGTRYQLDQQSGSGAWGTITGTLNDQVDLRNTREGGFGITLDGQGGVVSTGSKGYVTIPYNGTITRWSVTNDVSGSIQFDIKRSSASIVGAGNKPLTSGAISGTAAVSGWTSVAVTAGDIIEFNCDSASTVTRSTLVIYVTKT